MRKYSEITGIERSDNIGSFISLKVDEKDINNNRESVCGVKTNKERIEFGVILDRIM